MVLIIYNLCDLNSIFISPNGPMDVGNYHFFYHRMTLHLFFVLCFWTLLLFLDPHALSRSVLMFFSACHGDEHASLRPLTSSTSCYSMFRRNCDLLSMNSVRSCFDEKRVSFGLMHSSLYWFWTSSCTFFFLCACLRWTERRSCTLSTEYAPSYSLWRLHGQEVKIQYLHTLCPLLSHL